MHIQGEKHSQLNKWVIILQHHFTCSSPIKHAYTNINHLIVDKCVAANELYTHRCQSGRWKQVNFPLQSDVVCNKALQEITVFDREERPRVVLGWKRCQGCVEKRTRLKFNYAQPTNYRRGKSLTCFRMLILTIQKIKETW